VGRYLFRCFCDTKVILVIKNHEHGPKLTLDDEISFSSQKGYD